MTTQEFLNNGIRPITDWDKFWNNLHSQLYKPVHFHINSNGDEPIVYKTLPSSVKTLPSSVKTLPSSVKTLPSSVKTLPSSVKTLPSSVKTLPSSVKTLPSSLKTLPSSVKTLPSSVKTTIYKPSRLKIVLRQVKKDIRNMINIGEHGGKISNYHIKILEDLEQKLLANKIYTELIDS